MKRIYNQEGDSAPAWFARLALVLFFIPINVWAIVIGIRAGLSETWLEMRINCAEFKRIWKSAR